MIQIRFPKNLECFSFFISAFLPAIVSSPALGYAPDPPTETSSETSAKEECAKLLRQDKLLDLDEKFNGLQADYEQGKISDINLLHISRAFYLTGPLLESTYDKWVSGYPSSYAARLARGIYLIRTALEFRGEKYIDETPQENIVKMEKYLRKAMIDFNASLALSPKPIVTLYNIHYVFRLWGQVSNERKVLDAAIHVDPNNFIVRYAQLLGLQTRWGGSLQQMLDLRSEAQRDGLPDDLLKYFDDLIATERAWLLKTARH
jgi:hypothetical protein